MNHERLRKLGSGLLAALLLLYIGYQVVNAGYQSVQTETAVYASLQDVVQADAFAVRQETAVMSQTAGVVSYRQGEGGKVAKGGVVAEIYRTAEDAAAQQELEKLDEEIETLQDLAAPGETYAANPDRLEEQVQQEFTTLLRQISEENFSELDAAGSALLKLLNQKQIVTGKTENFNARIQELQAQRSALAASAGQPVGTVTSPVSGYFTRAADGLESLVPYETVLDLTPDAVRQALQAQAAPPDGAVGRVCSEFNWYLVCVVDADTALKLDRMANDGRRVSVSLPFASSEQIPAQVAAVNQEDRDSEAAVVLQCTYMNAELAAIRQETIQIQMAEYEGIRVSQKSIRFEDVTVTETGEDGETRERVVENVCGVYVMHGSEIEFVQIFPLFSSENYVICEVVDEYSDRWEELATSRSVELSDEVVVEGTDLYDGKVVK